MPDGGHTTANGPGAQAGEPGLSPACLLPNRVDRRERLLAGRPPGHCAPIVPEPLAVAVLGPEGLLPAARRRHARRDGP